MGKLDGDKGRGTEMKKGGLPGKRRACDGARVGSKEKGRVGRVAREENVAWMRKAGRRQRELAR